MINVNQVIESGGLIAVGLMVFAETGLLIGFFLPGDTLLFSSGIFAATGKINIIALLVTVILSSIIGNQVGYQIGEKTGHKIFNKEDGIFFRKEYILKAQAFYEKHGGKTVVLARFIPVVRTFAPVVAGMGDMNQASFTLYNIVGGILWGGGITLLGYVFGNKIPNIEKYVVPIFILANIITWSPVVYHALKDPVTRKKITHKITPKSLRS
jgi:membrane-associated protein